MDHSNIFLTGFMGAGKSLVGSRLAESLNKTFVDSDEVLERKTGKTISQLFTVNINYFRLEEAKVVTEIAKNKNQVVALGGGALLRNESRTLVFNSGIVIYMSAQPETLLKRLESSDVVRPLLEDSIDKQGSKIEKIEKLLREREPLYKMANYTVQTDGLSADQVAQNILTVLKSEE